MIKAILFDFFDTIAADFYRVWLERNHYSRTGEFLDVAQAVDRGDISLNEWYARLSKLSGQPADTIRQEFETKTQLNDSMIELIDQLRDGYQIGLVTNSPQGLVRKILQINNIERYFDEIVISGEIGLIKPDPKIFKVALKKLNLSATEVVFVDDLENYLEGAKQAGIPGILFTDIDQLKSDLRKAGVTILLL